ncbi:MAG TPA: glycine cleavage system aminomethyltransferase GcvT [Pirellulaceae bacterium]|nr:glycine cleavage system aminomethyltransferase GcvT [Pirellulaceae bacterium]
MTDSLARTPLYDWHVARNARMVDFAGWSMPVQYSSIVAEHNATRNAVGVFDISHMGRLRFDGEGAARFLDRLLTRRVVGIDQGLIRYSLVTNEAGGILDDVLVYHLADAGGHLADAGGHPFYLLVVNASNRAKIVAWIERHLSSGDDVSFRDETVETAMIAVQGPRALEALQPLVDVNLCDMRYYSGQAAQVAGHAGIISRTGYTGEDGCELIVSAASAGGLVDRLFAVGEAFGIQPAGLGARDTLRLEAAMPLYGHELSEAIDPFQAGLGFAVHLKDRDFIGATALSELKDRPNQPRRVGLELSNKRVPREHYPVLLKGEAVGEITSGTFSPTLDRPIAMAYVQPIAAELGTELTVDIRGRGEAACVVSLPFYKRSRP